MYLTKPAGVFVQLVGLFALLMSVGMGAQYGFVVGVLTFALAIGLFWLGRQTGDRVTDRSSRRRRRRARRY